MAEKAPRCATALAMWVSAQSCGGACVRLTGMISGNVLAMSDRHSTVLLVSNNAVDRDLVQRAMAVSNGVRLHLEQVSLLSDAIDRLANARIDAVLLDLFLPDSQGLQTFEAVLCAAPLIPILLLMDAEDEQTACKAMERGARDHLVRDHLDAYWLPRILRGVIERKVVEEGLYAEQERARVTLDSIGDAILSTDRAGNVIYLNSVAEKMTGWTCGEARGRALAEVFPLIDGVTREPALDPLALTVRQHKTMGLTANCVLIRRDGSEFAIEDSAAPIHDRSGLVTGAVIVFHDVSAARSVMQRMSHLAQHDYLTDLPNRMLFIDRVSNAIALARRHGKQCAVLFLDLDGFKQINDAQGHSVGDELLLAVSQRLVSCVRGSDTVSRQGGDEFAVLLSEIENVEDATTGAQKLLQTLAAPYAVGGKRLLVGGSIGISIYPADGHDAESLIKRADIAMYEAKSRGRNNFRLSKEDKGLDAIPLQFHFQLRNGTEPP